ncbi:Retrovirus-related Pol polyprotein from transposon opus [Nosema granulosis]|uniref:Retrovirus-related Pol polyprotein from transposon opus n=1 Tax=Nosema granulosis TaxID=83296 RepID=A0A9P6GZ87_9MICR|nr:Retrovirus-related Pol polyprotein from transposon opus [Nosema granulosis]
MYDILIYSKTREEHDRHVKLVKAKLEDVWLQLNLKKCEYGKTEIKILGHVIADGCVKVDPEKVRDIKELPLPGSIKKLQSFIGLFNYCSKHIKDSYKLLKDLYAILGLKGKEEEEFWKGHKENKEYKKMIDESKESMKRAASLKIPDLNKKLY